MYNSYSDTELVSRLNLGDINAFNEIYQRYWSSMYSSAFSVLKDHEPCMDIIQDVFIWVWNNRASLQVSSLKAYLHSSVKYKAANFIRQEKVRDSFYIRAEQLQAYEPTYNDHLEVKELRRVIDQFTEELPERWKEVFRLSRFEYLSNREIAEKLGVSEKTVEKHITSSLKRLRFSLSRFLLLTLLFLFSYFL